MEIAWTNLVSEANRRCVPLKSLCFYIRMTFKESSVIHEGLLLLLLVVYAKKINKANEM